MQLLFTDFSIKAYLSLLQQPYACWEKLIRIHYLYTNRFHWTVFKSRIKWTSVSISFTQKAMFTGPSTVLCCVRSWNVIQTQKWDWLKMLLIDFQPWMRRIVESMNVCFPPDFKPVADTENPRFRSALIW